MAARPADQILRAHLLAFATGRRGIRATMRRALEAADLAEESGSAGLDRLANKSLRILSELDHGHWRIEEARSQIASLVEKYEFNVTGPQIETRSTAKSVTVEGAGYALGRLAGPASAIDRQTPPRTSIRPPREAQRTARTYSSQASIHL